MLLTWIAEPLLGFVLRSAPRLSVDEIFAELSGVALVAENYVSR